MQLSVKRMDGTVVVVEVDASDTWSSVITKLAGLTGAVSTEGWKLVHQGGVVEPSKALPNFQGVAKPFVVLIAPKPKAPEPPPPVAPTPAPGTQAAPANAADAHPGVDPDALAQLVGMGFDSVTATRALQSAYAPTSAVSPWTAHLAGGSS